MQLHSGSPLQASLPQVGVLRTGLGYNCRYHEDRKFFQMFRAQLELKDSL